MKARRSPPLWLLPVSVLLLLLSPVPWSTSAMILAVVTVTAARAGVAARRRARRSRLEATASGAIVLGSDARGRAITLSDRELSAHGLILGASGAGKSTTLLRILGDQVERGGPVIAIDMKGSPAFAQQLAQAAERAGRPFVLWTPDGPSHWNPLARGNATELKDKLVATERFTEPHYQRAAERYIQLALQLLIERHPQRPPTLAEVVGAMDPKQMPVMLRGRPTPLLERVQDYLAGMPADQLSAVRGLGTRLAIITESTVAPYLAPAAGDRLRGSRNVDLRDALSGRDVVLFSLNSSRYGQLAAQLGTLIVQDLVSAVGERLSRSAAAGHKLPQAIVGIDEFSALGADHVIALLARGREAGVGTLLATQELADLDRAAFGLRDQVLGNTALKIAHRQDVPASAQTVAQMAGTEKTWEKSEHVAGGLLGGYPTRGGTLREVEQFVVHPNEIKTLPTGEAVVISKLTGARAQTARIAAPGRGLPARERKHRAADLG